MAAAAQHHELGAGDLLRHALHDLGRRGLVIAARDEQRGNGNLLQAAAAIEGGKQLDRLAVGRRRDSAHDRLRARQSLGIGDRATHRRHELRRKLGHRFALIERADARGDELARELAAAVGETRGGKAQHQRLHEVREARVGILRDVAAHAVPDEDHRLAAERFDQALQRSANLLQVVRLDDRAVAVAGLIPGVRGIAPRGEKRQLPVPGVVTAAKAVQKQQMGHGRGLKRMPHCM